MSLPPGIVWVFLAVFLGGCAGLPTDYPRQRSEALHHTDDTRIGREVAPLLTVQPGKSGFFTLGNGLDAFVARLALAEAADRTLDVQYYLFHDDVTGRLLAAHLLRAADRGVRVRLLLDDMDMGGKDAGLATVSLHPNIEIRLFNPFPSRGMRLLNFLTHFGTVTRRMHNKSFTVDNQLAIVGGRNIGDKYFEAAAGVNFGDMDVLAVGPIVREVSAAFDVYWNSELAVPVEALGATGEPELLERARTRLAADIEALPDTVYGRRLQEAKLTQRFRDRNVDFFWGPARLLYDLPEKVRTDPDDRSTHLGPELDDLLASVQTEVILVSPYFVPGREGTALLRSLVERGRRVTVLTNSLAATDVAAVHAGYARYRRSLVEAGVEIYEMRPVQTAEEAGRPRFGESQASLHAKTIVFDRERVLVGSMNLDPRSRLLNTEMAILIESPELASAIGDWRDEGLADIAWRVDLERVATPHSPVGEETRLVWVSHEEGRESRRYDREPESGLWARFQAMVLRLLPVERQL
ncbi:MAG: phospholipase D family protein [Sedimenticolaceae bacterium]